MSPMYTYLHNSYNTPTMLYLENGGHSGVTQGDNTAMAMHALSTQPLIQLTSIKQQMMMWNRYGLWMIALQLDH